MNRSMGSKRKKVDSAYPGILRRVASVIYIYNQGIKSSPPFFLSEEKKLRWNIVSRLKEKPVFRQIPVLSYSF